MDSRIIPTTFYSMMEHFISKIIKDSFLIKVKLKVKHHKVNCRKNRLELLRRTNKGWVLETVYMKTMMYKVCQVAYFLPIVNNLLAKKSGTEIQQCPRRWWSDGLEAADKLIPSLPRFLKTTYLMSATEDLTHGSLTIMANSQQLSFATSFQEIFSED